MRPYGPADSQAIDVVEAFDLIEPEYALLRKHAVMLDQPQRGTLEVRGADRIAFLNRMLTQELKGLEAFGVRRSFWLSRKGRIDADLRLIELPDRMLVDLDYFSTVGAGERQPASASLGSYIFSEDVRIEDQSERWHRLAMHGPAALAVLAKRSERVAGAGVLDLAPGGACVVRVAGHEVVADRFDSTGEIGVELLVPVEGAEAVYGALSTLHDAASRGQGEGWDKPASDAPARRIGWHAFNIARVEAGTPIFFIDFGPTSLPHETGNETLNDRVSFKKGCYLGQEVVARMQSLGHPKQKLVGLRISEGGLDSMPSTGCAVVHESDGNREIVGAITSSAHSPMLGGATIGFAMVKYKHASPGTRLFVECDEGSPVLLAADVQPALRFWNR